MNSSNTIDGEKNLLNTDVIAKSTSSSSSPQSEAQIVDDHVPICSICHLEFDPTNFTVLDCSHVFHSECIQHWLAIRQKCPYCNLENVTAHHIIIERRNNATGNEGNMEFSMVPVSNEALHLALIAYDRELHASSKDPIERAALETIFEEIRQKYQDEQNRQRRWELIKCAGFTILFALFFLLFIKTSSGVRPTGELLS